LSNETAVLGGSQKPLSAAVHVGLPQIQHGILAAPFRGALGPLPRLGRVGLEVEDGEKKSRQFVTGKSRFLQSALHLSCFVF
jgi:hypothetical protein